MEGNSLTQHDYYGSHLQNYTDMACIELLAFSVGRRGEGVRDREKLEFKVLETNVEKCYCI